MLIEIRLYLGGNPAITLTAGRYKTFRLNWYLFGSLNETFPNDKNTQWLDHFIWLRDAYTGTFIADEDFRGRPIPPWWLEWKHWPRDYDPIPF